MRENTNHICLATWYQNPSTWWKQTPKNDGAWQNTQFHINDESGCSWLCVFDRPQQEWTTRIPRTRRILIVPEPKSIVIVKDYKHPQNYLYRFGHIISPHGRHPFYRGTWYRSQPACIWDYGISKKRGVARHLIEPQTIKTWQMIGNNKKNKTKRVSVITSNLQWVSGHYQRNLFINALKQELVDRIDFFGYHDNFVSDKADALDAYKYHIAIENNMDKHLWTEKLADAYLAECYPIHAGCQNLHDYFPRQAYTSVNMRNIPQAIRIIKKVINSDLWQQNRSHILTAKSLVMERYNLFPMIADLVRQNNHLQEEPLLEKPEKIYPFNPVISYKEVDYWLKYLTEDYWFTRKRKLKRLLKKSIGLVVKDN